MTEVTVAEELKNSEHFKAPESRPEHLIRPAEHHKSAEHVKHQPIEALENLKLKIEQEAQSSSEIQVEQIDQEKKPLLINKELKAKALKDTLRQTRRHLNHGQRQFSKLIHAPAVEKISDIGSRTVARPSGLLGAGIAALVGGLGLLFISNHYGYEYRFSAYWLLLAVGFGLGILIDLGSKLLRRRS